MKPGAEEKLRQRGYGAVVDRAKAASPSPEEAQRRILDCLRLLDMLAEEEAADALSQDEMHEVLSALADNDPAAALWPVLKRKIALH